MRKSSLLKSLVVVVLSIVLVANLTSIVFADDNVNTDGWDSVDLTLINTNNATDTSTNTSTNTSTSTSTTNTPLNTNTGSATTTLNTSSSDNTNNSSVNSLAYTGIEDNSVLAVVIVLGVIVAAYSFKKLKEYNV